MRLNARYLPSAACWPAAITPIAAAPAPATAAATPSSIESSEIEVAALAPSPIEIACPPVTWPSSCAITPWTWLAEVDALIRPELM